MKSTHIIFGIIGIVLIGIGVFLFISSSRDGVVYERNGEQMCYFFQTPSEFEGYDRAYLYLEMNNENMTGLYAYEPSATDGRQTSLRSLKDLEIYDGYAEAFFETIVMAEGMNTREDFIIRFNNEYAEVGFGIMEHDVDADYYTYQNTKEITWQRIPALPCAELDDHIIISEYMRAMISEIAPVEAVLGGTWYVTSVIVDPQESAGRVWFEDGHIAEEAEFSYSREGNSVEIQFN